MVVPTRRSDIVPDEQCTSGGALAGCTDSHVALWSTSSRAVTSVRPPHRPTGRLADTGAPRTKDRPLRINTGTASMTQQLPSH